jgi:hypothetical protein
VIDPETMITPFPLFSNALTSSACVFTIVGDALPPPVALLPYPIGFAVSIAAKPKAQSNINIYALPERSQAKSRTKDFTLFI